jgi:hypothetical protein
VHGQPEVAGFARVDKNYKTVVEADVVALLSAFRDAVAAAVGAAKVKIFKELTLSGCRVFEANQTFAMNKGKTAGSAPVATLEKSDTSASAAAAAPAPGGWGSQATAADSSAPAAAATGGWGALAAEAAASDRS